LASGAEARWFGLANTRVECNGYRVLLSRPHEFPSRLPQNAEKREGVCSLFAMCRCVLPSRCIASMSRLGGPLGCTDIRLATRLNSPKIWKIAGIHQRYCGRSGRLRPPVLRRHRQATRLYM